MSRFCIKRSYSHLHFPRPYSSTSQIPKIPEKLISNIYCQWCPQLERMDEELKRKSYQWGKAKSDYNSDEIVVDSTYDFGSQSSMNQSKDSFE